MLIAEIRDKLKITYQEDGQSAIGKIIKLENGKTESVLA